MYEEASQVAIDAVGNIRTVSSFCAEKRVMTKYIKKCEASKNQGIRTGIVGGLGFGFSYMMLYVTSALCYYVGAKFISQGNSNFGNVFKVTTRNHFDNNKSSPLIPYLGICFKLLYCRLTLL